MSQVFFEELELPQPDIYLGVGSASHAQQTAHIMLAFEPVLLEHRPDRVIVVGDVNSTVACACGGKTGMAGQCLGIRVRQRGAGCRLCDIGPAGGGRRKGPERLCMSRLFSSCLAEYCAA